MEKRLKETEEDDCEEHDKHTLRWLPETITVIPTIHIHIHMAVFLTRSIQYNTF